MDQSHSGIGETNPALQRINQLKQLLANPPREVVEEIAGRDSKPRPALRATKNSGSFKAGPWRSVEIRAQSQTRAIPAIILRGPQMKHMHVVVQQLKKERERAQSQVQRINEALAALGSGSNGSPRTMSAAGRLRISLAQKARWAKQKGHAPKPTRTISAAGRKRIAAAQRARWAKIKRIA
jgi:hypothetical protein